MKKAIILTTVLFILSFAITGCQLLRDRTHPTETEYSESTETTQTTVNETAESEARAEADDRNDTNGSAGAPGWYLIEEMPIISENDITVHPDGGPGSTHMGDRYTDVHQGRIEKPVYELQIERVFEQGDISASGSVRIVWDDPAEVLLPDQKASLDAEVDIISSWSVANMTAAFEEIDIMPNYSSPSVIRFITSDGRNIPRGSDFTGSLTMENEVPEGNPGDKRAILISFGNGYGYRYIYEWQD